MSDYSESGAVPIEDAAVEHPPTVDEVAARQRRDYPEQAATSMHPTLDEPGKEPDSVEGDDEGAADR